MTSTSITVIVPIYNSKKTLPRTVDSLLNQSYPNYEILLVDDGSTDETSDLCDEYALKNANVKTIHKTNGGISSARNAGIDKVTTPWFTFVDSDDWVESDYLQNYIDVLADDSVELAIQGIHLYANNNTVPEDLKYPTSPKLSIQEVLNVICSQRMPGVMHNKLFKREIVNKYSLRFNELYKIKEDEDFLLRYMLHISKVGMNGNCSHHYYEPDWGKKYIANPWRVCKSMFDSIQQLGLDGLDSTVISRYVNQYANYFVDSVFDKTSSKADFITAQKSLKPYKSYIESRFARLMISFPYVLAKKTIPLFFKLKQL